MPLRSTLLALLLAGCSCGAPGETLSVALVTDLIAGGEYLTVRTELETLEGQPVVTEERRFGDGLVLLEPEPVAALTGLSGGRYAVVVTLIDPDGVEVISRRALAEVAGRSSVTVVITRSCLGMTCGGEEACVGGRCEALECGVDESACAEPVCDADGACGAITTACLTPRCAAGVCLAVPEHRRCTSALVCSPAGECVEDDFVSADDPTVLGPDGSLPDASGLACEVARIDRQGRVDIAAYTAMERFDPAAVDEVVLANAAHPTSQHLQSPDALVAGPLARAYGAPLLLVAPSTLLASTAEALEYLRPSRALIVGPPDPLVDERLMGMGIAVEHIGGADRYETAAAVARAVLDETGAGEVVVASGADEHLDEALLASAAAADLELPLLFLDGASVPAPTGAVITELALSWAALVGGPSAVSADLEAQLAARLRVTRYGGATPSETAVTVARGLFASPAPEALLVRGPGSSNEGATYGMGLTALAAPILFSATDGTGLDAATREYLSEGGTSSITIVGNTIAVGERVETEICLWLARD